MTTSVPIGTLRFERVLVHVLLVVHSVEIFQRGFAQMSTFEWLGLVQLALALWGTWQKIRRPGSLGLELR